MAITKPVRYVSLDEPLDDEERELMEPDNWDWEHPGEVVVSPNLTMTFEVSFSRDEVHLLSDAASTANMPVNRYIKRAALEKARRTGD